MQLERIEISKLSNDPANARKHPERNLEAIVASLRRFGQQKPIVIDKSNVVRAGNGTIEAAKQLGWTHIDCVRTSLESSDAIAYAIADNRTSELAEWDDDVLLAQLEGLQFDGLLESAGYTDEELQDMLAESLEETEQAYTRKIEAPIYRKTKDKPDVKTLVDKSKSVQLIKEIREAGLDKEVEDFLVDAARRHNVFNFEDIAEFYCHSESKVQELMERSALVVIDFGKAIENGYVALAKELANIYAEEYSDGK